MKPRVLIIDDDKEFIQDISVLMSYKFECNSATDAGKGLQRVHQFSPQVILLDLMLGDENGLDILQVIHRYDETIPVIMLTDYASVDTAVKAIKMGAFDYISKSPNIKELSFLIEKAIQKRSETFKTSNLKEELKRQYVHMIGHSEVMRDVWDKISLYAAHKNTVLIAGESGVGKELVARQVHTKGPYSDEPFVAINCAAIPKDLVESELFGHEKGAFTGADKRKIGKFEIAGDGVVFLDEISELSLDVQVKLLRVLQEREFQRVGGTTDITFNAKIISATNKNLKKLVEEGAFREDLFYRLDVLPIDVPPLRNRKEDISELVTYFIHQICTEMKIPQKKCGDEVMIRFRDFSWPGNIRQLKNFVTRAVLISTDSEIRLNDLDSVLLNGKNEANDFYHIPKSWEELDRLRKQVSEQAVRKVEQQFVDHLMKKFDHNVTKAAEHAGISRTNLHKMIRRAEGYSSGH